MRKAIPDAGRRIGIMRNCLFATASLAFVSSPAMAADMLSVGVGGYMQQWFGMASRSDKDEEGGWAAQSDSEIFVKGSLESDSGLKFSVHMEIEGDRGSNAIDESFARVSGEFGQIEFGARDHVMVRMHSGISDVGIGLSSGDTQKWVPGTYLETAGHAIGNARKLNYISPRISGLQLGVSYAPDDTAQDANTGAPSGNDNAGWGAGLNFQQDVGDMSVTFSLGHKSADSAGAEVDYMSAMAPATGAGGADDPRLSQAQHAAHMKAWEKWEYLASTDKKNKVKTLGTAADAQDTELTNIAQMGLAGRAAIMGATDSMTKGDASTYTNAGVGIGFGAFKFNIAYATADGGAYTAMDMPVKMTPAEMIAHAGTITNGSAYDSPASGTAATQVTSGDTATHIIDTAHRFDHDKDGCATEAACTTGKFSSTNPGTAGVLEAAQTADAAAVNDPANETWMASKVVKDGSKDYDVWGVSVSYSDGPMALSLGHMVHEDDAGGEREATMLSASYSLAPGVAWKSSVFTVEDTTSNKNVTGGMNEGTGFVTGITLGF